MKECCDHLACLVAGRKMFSCASHLKLSNGIAITFKRFTVEGVELHVLQIDQGNGQPADLVHFPDIDEVREL